MYLTKRKCNELLEMKVSLEVEYEGEKYLIVEHAEMNDVIMGDITDTYYKGTAVLLQDVIDIVNGKTKPINQETDDYELDDYTIEWDIYDEYFNEEGILNSENDYIKSLESDTPVRLLEDEHDACDWDLPRKIFKNR